MTNKIILFISVVLVVIIIFVYPTPYYYTSIKMNTFEMPVKINRITGSAYMLYNTGWEKMMSK